LGFFSSGFWEAFVSFPFVPHLLPCFSWLKGTEVEKPFYFSFNATKAKPPVQKKEMILSGTVV
jgi:hypothetical protein